MTGQAPEIAPYAEPESQDPAPIVQSPSIDDRQRRVAIAEQRLNHVLEQNVKWRQASALGDNRPFNIEDAQDLAMENVHRTITNPETGPKFLDWLTGKTDDAYKAAFDQKLTELGDLEVAKKHADKVAGYQPPFGQLENDPWAQQFDPESFKDRAGTNAFRDYVFEPFARYMTGRAQMIADSVVGLTSIAADVTGADSIRLPARDVYTSVSGLLGGDSSQSLAVRRRRAEIEKEQYDASRSTASSLLQGGARIAGEIQGVVKGLGGASAFSAGSALSGRILASAPSWVQAAGRGAAGFGAHHFLTAGGGTADIGERLSEATKGAFAGVLAEGATAVGRAAFRSLMAPGIDPTGKAREAILNWTAKNNIAPHAGESVEDFLRRSVAQFVDAGAPGVQMAGHRIAAHGIASLAEAGAFGAVDMHFLQDAYAAIWDKDPEARARALRTYFESALGMGMLRAGGEFSRMREQQRATPNKTQNGQVGDPQTPLLGYEGQRSRGEPRDAEWQFSQPPKELPDVSATRAEAQVKDQAIGERFAPGGVRTKQTDPESSLAAEAARAAQAEDPIPQGYREPSRDLLRLGWTTEPQEPSKRRPNYTNDNDSRKNRAVVLRQASGDARSVRINGFGAQEAKRYFPRKSDIYKALDALGETGGEVLVSPQDAQHLAANLARMAPKLRAKMGDEVANPRIQTVDSFVSRVMEAYGLDPTMPRAQRVEGVKPEPEWKPKDLSDIDAETAGAVEPAPQPEVPQIVRLQDSPYTYEVKGDLAIPSPALREATGLPEMPVAEFEDSLSKLTLANRLQSKALLPGEEIDAWNGIKAEVVGDKGVMRAVRFGEVVESALRPDGEWKKLANVPVRAPDEIPPQQQEVSKFLEQFGERQDLTPEDHAVLGSSIGVMSTVSMERDPAVAEAVTAVRDLVPFLSADPQTAGEAIKALGEILTTKNAKLAIEDMLTAAEEDIVRRERTVAAANEVKAAAEKRGGAVAPSEAIRVVAEAGGRSDIADAMKEVGERIDSWPTSEEWTTIRDAWRRAVSSGDKKEADKLNDILNRNSGQEFRDTISKLGLSAVSEAEWGAIRKELYRATDMKEKKDAKFLSGVIERGSADEIRKVLSERGLTPRQPGRITIDRSGESGAVSVDVLTAPIATAAKIAEAGMHWFGEGQIDRINRKIGPEMAARARRVQTNFLEMRRELQGPIRSLEKMGAATPQLSKVVQWETVRPGLRYGPDGFQAFGNDVWMQRLNLNRSMLDRDSARQLSHIDDILKKTRERSHDFGMVMENVFDPATGNRVPIARERDTIRQPYFLTEAARQAFARRDPDALEVLAKAHNSDPIAMADILEREGYTGAQALSRPDSIERRSSLPFIPTFVEKYGKVERWLETRPILYAEHLVNRFAMRTGVVQEFGQGFAPVGQGSKEAMKDYVPYTDVLSQLMPEHRAEMADFLRRASGMRVETDSPGEQVARQWIGPWVGLANALKLTGFATAAQNLVEPLNAGLAIYGPKRIGKAIADTVADIASGNIGKTIDDLIDRGGFLPIVHEPTTETAREVASKWGRIAMTLFDKTQTFNDVVLARANLDLVEEMRAGTAGGDGVNLAMSVGGYSVKDARRISRGDGRQDEYDFLLESALPRLAGRGTTKVDLAKSAEVARRGYVPFLSHVQRMTGIANRLMHAVRTAETVGDRTRASLELLKFLGITSLNGHLARVLGTLLTAGWDEAVDKAIPDSVGQGVGDFLLGMTTGLLGSAGATLFGAIEGLFSSGSDSERNEKLGRAVTNTSAPLSVLFEVGSLAASLADPTTQNSYRGHSVLGKFAVFAERMAPVVRDIDRGLGGLPGIAITSDPDVRLARNKMFAWQKEHGFEQPHVSTSGDTNSESAEKAREFGAYMRQFTLELKDPRQLQELDAGELARRIIDGLPEGKGIRSAVASLRQDLQLDWVNDLSAEDRASFEKAMGEKRLKTLEGYDMMVRSVINRLDPPELKWK